MSPLTPSNPAITTLAPLALLPRTVGGAHTTMLVIMDRRMVPLTTTVQLATGTTIPIRARPPQVVLRTTHALLAIPNLAVVGVQAQALAMMVRAVVLHTRIAQPGNTGARHAVLVVAGAAVVVVIYLVQMIVLVLAQS